ncbi:unnamed protein product [Bursaphelenchus xylophilus]|uniref:(pine wood nematode) hypothetical protein n=1 Tax=Bursaphelenchus xylophilus TaxID=6326 RepID=A0A1I7RNT2_BURXY|nr:unnamed protein product [Bursaphelenchus xylophilus]CAG9124270.1 unnamed protein product [Bursaphelenchus xylophilus]
MAKKIPSSWIRFKPIGDQIEGTRFICFKTPLSEDRFVGCGLEEDKIFTVSELVKRINEKGKRLGMVVSCCSRLLYDPAELEKNGVECHVQVPHVTREAEKAILKIKKYLSKQKDQNVVVGIHCLHGINRTGFLTCTYMIKELGLDAEEAIRRFETARGHEIETTKSDIRRQQ